MATQEKNQLKLFRVRDLRKKQQFIIDDAYLDDWAKFVKPIGTAAYMSLCRHADKEQKAWPSQELMANQHGIGVRTIRRGLKKLQEFHIIEFEQIKGIKGRFQRGIYYLIDKSHWKKLSVGQKRPTAIRRPETVGRITAGGKVPTKDTHLKDSHLKDLKEKEINKEKENLKKFKVMKLGFNRKTEMFSSQERTRIQEGVGFQIRHGNQY